MGAGGRDVDRVVPAQVRRSRLRPLRCSTQPVEACGKWLWPSSCLAALPLPPRRLLPCHGPVAPALRLVTTPNPPHQRNAAAMEEEDALGDSILASYPLRLQDFDPDAFPAAIVNAVIEISTNRFIEMEKLATRMLKITTKEAQEALQQGLSTVLEKFLSKFVQEDLGRWETYCKEDCLKVPVGLVIPEKFDAPSNVSEDEDAKLDAELISLRERKAAAEKEAAELRRDIKALKAHVEAKANFMDAFHQLQNLPLVDDLGTAARELRKSVEEANALRAQRYQKLLFPANPSASGESG